MMRRIGGKQQSDGLGRDQATGTLLKMWARRLAMMAAALAGAWCLTSANAAQVSTGVRGQANYRAVVNMRGLAIMQSTLPESSVTNRSFHFRLPSAEFPRENPNGGGADAVFAPAAAPQVPSPAPSVSFSALDDNLTQLFPNSHGAVGPNHVMTVTESQVRVQDRTGNVLTTVDLNAFWQATGGPEAFNPKVLYDPYAQRWMFTAGADPATPSSAVLMAVSQTDDPTGGWFLYRVKVDVNNLSYADYLSLGFNKDWIVVSANMFPIVNTNAVGFDGVNIYVFNKTNLYANGTGQFTLLRDGSTFGFSICPTITYDNELPVMHLVEVDNLFYNFGTTSKRLRLSTITGQIGAEVLALGTGFTPDTNEWASAEPLNFFGGLAPQLNSIFNIFNWDSSIQNVVYRNGNLWLTHTVFLPSEVPTHCAVQWWQVATNGATLQFGRIEDPTAITHYATPSIAVNRNEDVLIGFSRFSSFQFPSANYALRTCLDAPGTMRGDFVLKDGEAPYAPFGGLLFINPWSIYSSTVVDPVNDTHLWTIQQYGLSPTNLGGFPIDRWGTWWGQVQPTESCFRIDFVSSFYNVNEATPGLATISVLNLGGAAGTVDFATSDGTAIAGVDYLPRTGTLTFSAGQFETNFTIVILDNAVVNSNKTVNLSLLNPSGPATLGRITNAVLTIEDDETLAIETRAGEFVFSSYLNSGVFYQASEYESQIWGPCNDEPSIFILPGQRRSALGCLVTVVRTNGVRGRVMVDYATLEGGTALPFVDYTPVSGTMVFDDYQTSTNFLVQVFPNFGLLTEPGLRFIRVGLSNPRAFPEENQHLPGTVRPKLGLGLESGILVYDINRDPILRTNLFAFERENWRVDEYTSPTTPDGLRFFNIQIINPPGANGFEGGRVRFETRENPRVTYIFDRAVLTASSDFAEAPDPDPGAPALSGTQVWPNPPIFDPALTTITNYADYMQTSMIVTFAQDECRKNITLVITNDPTAEFNEDIMLVLVGIRGERRGPNPYAAISTLTIMFDDQPAGTADREWNPANLPASDPPLNQTPGANYPVRALALQANGKVILGGDFDHVNAVRRPGVARMNVDGSLDRMFDPGVGADGFVTGVYVYPLTSPDADKVLVVGGFSSFNGTQRNGIVRLLANGALDPGFFPGSGANGAVWGVAVQADGRIVVVGDFTEFNDRPRNGVARLNVDGSLDETFDPGNGPGPGGFVNAVGLYPDPAGGGEKVVVGGAFSTFAGEFSSGIVRLNQDGTVDSNFRVGGGVVGFVNSLAVQANGAVVIGGSFSEVDGVIRTNLARLNSDGSLDPNFDPGFGPNGQIMVVTLQPDGKALIGGPFTTYNNTRRLGFARLRLDGTLDTSFLDTAYNQFAGLPTTFSFESPNFATAFAVQADGNIIVGGSFTNIGGNPSYRAPVRNPYTVFTRADKVVRYNIARVIGGATPGPGNAEFETKEYFADENGNVAAVQLQRSDGRLGSLSAVAEATNGVAVSGLDFVSTNLPNTWREGYRTLPAVLDIAPVSVGQVSDVFMRVPLLDDSLLEGDETVTLNFLRPESSVTLGGDLIPLGGALGRAHATLNIGDNDVKRGFFTFGTPHFVTNENVIEAVISVIRTNGSLGAVSVDYFTRTTTNTPVATINGDYRPTSGTLFFASGTTNRDFRVRLIDDEVVEFDENVELVLTNATGGSKLPGGLATSVALANLAIIDNDFSYGRLNFALTSYPTNESSGFATIAVTRSGGSLGQVSLQYTTGNGTATSPADYAATAGTLQWDDGDTATKSFDVPLVADGVVDNDLTRFETVALRLLNPRIGTVTNPTLLGSRTNAVLVIEDSDAYGGLAFSQPVYQADENGSSAIITVVRRGGFAGNVSVDVSTAPVDPLSPGTDYQPVNTTLTLLPGESSKTFAIPLIDEAEPDGNKDVILTLSNPVRAILATPTSAKLTIVDNESFSIPAGDLDTVFSASAEINGPVYTLALQPDARILVAGDFTEINNVSRASIGRLTHDANLDTSFSPGLGPNGPVRSIALQSDGKIIAGGLFSQFNGTNRNGIVRLNADGGVDTFFNPGAGANNPIYAVALTPDERVMVAGGFSTFNSITRPGVVRLNTNGTVDLTFDPGSGANNIVYALAQQSDGKVIVGGDFTQFNGQTRVRIARLNRNGSLDSSFNPGATFDGAIRAIVVQSDGRIIVGGSFRTANGIARNYLARLNADGTLDTSFSTTFGGGDGPVFALALQVDEKLVVAGDFTQFNNVTRNRLTRLNTDGSSDTSINFGTGADGFIAAILIQPDRKIVIGGGFTKYNDKPRLRIARIYGGSIGGAITGAGAIEFSRAEFIVTENVTNALITVRRRFGTAGLVSVDYRTVDGTAIAGVHYEATTGTLIFPDGETQARFFVPIIDNQATNADVRLTLELLDSTFTGGATNGPQPIARLLILDDEGAISLSQPDYVVGENVASGVIGIGVTRHGGTNFAATVNFATANGTATAGGDYFATNGVITFLPGEVFKLFHVRIVNDAIVEPNERFTVNLSNPSGSNVLGVASAPVVILEDDFAAGQFVLNSAAYSVNEGNGNAIITVLRTNGSSGVASIRYRTADNTAQNGADYVGTNAILAFADGELAKTVQITILDDLLVEPLETFSVTLFGATGGPSVGALSNAFVTITDTDVSVIAAAGSALVAESFLPPNGVIDPGENVTVALGLENNGTANTMNLVATLIPGNGVTAPSGPQPYGVLVANGPPVTQNFSFTAVGNSGDRVIATLRLVDNGVTNGFVSFPFTLGGQATRNLSNTNRITINDNNTASPYPSTIEVLNLGGEVTSVTVTISNLSHTFPDDLDFLLVSPQGQKVTLLSDAGGNIPVNNVTLTFSPVATNLPPDAGPLITRTYLPTNYAGLGTADLFPAPAPGIPYTNSFLGSFNGTDPNGVWSLYVVDDNSQDSGSIANGWRLSIQTSDPVSPAADVGLAAAAPNPVTMGVEFPCILTVTNRGPSDAHNVTLLDQMPSGLAFVRATSSTGTLIVVGNTMTWNIGTIPQRSSATVTIVARADTLGTLINQVQVGASQVDLRPIDNSAVMQTTVIGSPTLSVQTVGGVVRISWPSIDGFSLQSSESLSSGAAGWTNVTVAPQVIGSQKVVDLPLQGTGRFYRLRSQ